MTLLQLAREAGCVYLFIGLESFSEEGLASVNKGFNQVARYAETIRRIHQHGICVQAGVIFGFDTDSKDVFARTLQACESMGIDGVTVSVLTPLPGTRLYDEMQQEGRLLGNDWAWFNGKTRVAFQPRQMSAEELFAGYMWFRRQFYSFRSLFRRLAVSRTNLVHNLFVNLGYRWSLWAAEKEEWVQKVRFGAAGERPGGFAQLLGTGGRVRREYLCGGSKKWNLTGGSLDIYMKVRMKRILAGLTALVVAALIWLPCLHFLFTRPVSEFRRDEDLSPKAQQLAARHLQLWTEPVLREQELKKMRASNAEWDFMGRSYLVWSLANMALRDPASKPLYLQTMDLIIDETLRLEKQEGMYFFLMPYALDRPYLAQPAHSLFLDGEIALMLASRRAVDEKPEYKPLLTERVNAIVDRFQKSPRMLLESYPDECWMFDHCVALDAIKLADFLDGSDHTALIRNWLTMAKQKLVDPKTGLLISSFTTDGTPLDGPEGSTIWMVTHSLQLLDEDFARDQYQRARKELGAITLGFGYAHEWPKSWKGQADVDSGPIIPGFEISAGSSGMAFIGAASFGDDSFLVSLAATLDFAGFPSARMAG